MQLHEQYRPQTWGEVTGQDKVISKIDRLRARGLAGRAYWLSGQSGTGKTTIARLIAAEAATEWNTEEVDAIDLSAARIRELERQSLAPRHLSIRSHAVQRIALRAARLLRLPSRHAAPRILGHGCGALRQKRCSAPDGLIASRPGVRVGPDVARGPA